MKTNGSAPIYVFDETVARRLRNMTRNFAAAIDQLIAGTRIEPLENHEASFEELGFWEAKASLDKLIDDL